MLSWQAPFALLALLPLGGLLVLLYLLRLRRREVTVPSTLLWRRAVQDVQANVPFQKLRRNLLLLLQLAALLLVVLCLGGPYVLGRSTAGHSLVLVLDGSASMAATDVPGTRFGQARQEALRRVQQLAPGDQIAVLFCGLRPQVVCPFSGDRRRLTAVLQGLRPTQGPTRLREGLALAESLARRRPGSLIYLLSDGAWSPIAGLKAPGLRFVRLGRRGNNLALVAFGAERDPARGTHALFLRVSNCSASAAQCVLSIYHEQQLLSASRLSLPPHGSRIVNCSVRLPQPGLLRAELDAGDDLRADNVAYAVAEEEGRTRVLLVSAGNLFLQQGLAVLPGVALYQASGLTAEQLAGAAEQYDVVVLDRVPLPAAPSRGGYLLVGALGAGAPAEAAGVLEAPAITRYDQTHPLLAHVNLGDLQLAKAQALRPGPQGRSLVEAGPSPLLVVSEQPGLRMAALGLDLLDTDLPLRVSFPVFLRNAVSWLGAAGGRERLLVTRPGEVLRTPVTAAEGDLVLTLPDRSRRAVQPVNGEVVWADTSSVGVYTLGTAEGNRRWAVDLRDPDEADLTPRGEVDVGGRTLANEQQPPLGRHPVWPTLAALALALLLVEWHLYHRRL